MDQKRNNNNFDFLGVSLTQLFEAQEESQRDHQEFIQGMKGIRVT